MSTQALLTIVNFICHIVGNTSIANSTLVFNMQSICTEAGKPADKFNVNCVGHRCVQIQGTDLVALGITVNGRLSVTVSKCCYRYHLSQRARTVVQKKG